LLIQIKKKGENTYGCHDKQQKLSKNMAQQIYEDEVKKRCYKSLTQAGADNLIIFGNNG
jgi:hypothetical protein